MDKKDKKLKNHQFYQIGENREMQNHHGEQTRTATQKSCMCVCVLVCFLHIKNNICMMCICIHTWSNVCVCVPRPVRPTMVDAAIIDMNEVYIHIILRTYHTESSVYICIYMLYIYDRSIEHIINSPNGGRCVLASTNKN